MPPFGRPMLSELYAHEGALTLRLAAQIYNDMDDVDRLADAVLKRT